MLKASKQQKHINIATYFNIKHTTHCLYVNRRFAKIITVTCYTLLK